MVKENGMVMMSETEYKEMKDKLWDYNHELDIAKMELLTYHKSMREIAKQNLRGKTDENKLDIEIPAKDLVNIMESSLGDGWDDDDYFESLDRTDLVVSWNGFTSKLMWGPWLFNGLLDTIKECYEEINE